MKASRRLAENVCSPRKQEIMQQKNTIIDILSLEFEAAITLQLLVRFLQMRA